MNDYFIDEKLLKEFKDCNSNVNYKEPTPMPKKIPHANFSSMQFSNQASQKKELLELEHKFKNLEKAHNKLLKKNSEIQEDIKVLKNSNESLSKEINIIQISNEKIL